MVLFDSAPKRGSQLRRTPPPNLQENFTRRPRASERLKKLKLQKLESFKTTLRSGRLKIQNFIRITRTESAPQNNKKSQKPINKEKSVNKQKLKQKIAKRRNATNEKAEIDIDLAHRTFKTQQPNKTFKKIETRTYKKTKILQAGNNNWVPATHTPGPNTYSYNKNNKKH
ncbi:MAG: hypothetical protein Q6366_008665 [Candidatus Freyarchaeota archaeon]